MKLNYYDNSWELVDYCPCDPNFVRFLESNRIEGKLIFHFGTGEHHLVGRDNYERGNPNEIWAITASRREHDAYIDFIVDNPRAANYYKVLYADIYTLSPRMLPNFDIVTLFHLCEYYDEVESGSPRLNSEYAQLDDEGLVEMFLTKLNSGGRIAFYAKSGGFISSRLDMESQKLDHTEAGPFIRGDRKGAKIVNDLISRGRIAIQDEYETLVFCGCPGN